mgnify:CR=1 FL=1
MDIGAKERNIYMKLDLYHMNIEYNTYLQHYDTRVAMLKRHKEDRPFIGTVFYANDKKFFAPLTSPKEKHLYMKDTKDFVKIEEGKLGGINLNNMIPVPEENIERIVIENIKDEKYANMLQKQIYWIKANQEMIMEKAHDLYYLIIDKQANERLQQRCCNFKILEEKYTDYIEKSNYLRETEIVYYYIA